MKPAPSTLPWLPGLAGLLLALLAALAPWVAFPLSAPLRGLDFASSGPDLAHRLQALPFLLLLAASLLATATGRRRLAGRLWGGALLAWLAVPFATLVFDPDAVRRYVDDAVQLDGIQSFVRVFAVVPNGGIEQAVRDADTFAYLPDRLRLVSAMMAWGWYAALLGAILAGLTMNLLDRWPGWRATAWPLLAGIGCMAVLAGPTLLADLQYRQGDQRLGRGEYGGALAAYGSALNHDPLLAASRTFVAHAARAYYQQYGAEHPYGQLHVALTARDMTFGARRARLVTAMAATGADDDALGAALRQAAVRASARLWIQQGLAGHLRNDEPAAAESLRRALVAQPERRDVRLFLAYALMNIGEYEQSGQLLDELAASLRDGPVRANVYNAMGDAADAAGDHARARQAYATAFALDQRDNLWAVRGLGGT